MILVFGKTGQLARELAKHADVICVGRDGADLSEPSQCSDAIIKAAPKAVINAAAFTAVDLAESQESLAHVINADAPGVMATTCAARDIPFIHVSTDYVFDGNSRTPWQPDDTPRPLSAYGRTKLAGEQAIKAAAGRYVIFRTSWVFSEHGHNFVKSMLRAAGQRRSLNVVSDQIGAPTPAADLADACITAALVLADDKQKSGIYHFAGTPDTSWAEFAKEIMRSAGLTTEIVDIPTSAYPTAAKRPASSRLDCTTLADLGIARPNWHNALQQVIARLETDT